MHFLTSIRGHGRSDEDLIREYRETGDTTVLGNLYQQYMELVYGVCLKYFKNPDDAQDAVMAIFEELVTKLKKHEVENFRPWLHTVAKNYCLMKLRGGKKEHTVEFNADFMQSGEEMHLDNVLEKEAELDKMEDCINKLAPDQQQVVRMFYLESKSYKEISEQTGLDWNVVRSHIQNGRRNLKICMESKTNKPVAQHGSFIKK